MILCRIHRPIGADYVFCVQTNRPTDFSVGYGLLRYVWLPFEEVQAQKAIRVTGFDSLPVSCNILPVSPHCSILFIHTAIIHCNLNTFYLRCRFVCYSATRLNH